MIKNITLPNLGEGIDSAEISEIIVKKGDLVSPDDIILVLESEKASMEIPAEVEGKVCEIMVSNGQEISTGQVLLKIELSDIDIKKNDPLGSAENGQPDVESKTENIDQLKPEPKHLEIVSSNKDSVFASPGVRRLSRELDIDISIIKGSGPKGRITKDDLHKYIKRKISIAEGVSTLGPSRPDIDFSQWGNVDQKKLTKINLITGKRLQNAWQSIPHVTQFDFADITELDLYRKSLKIKAEKSNTKVTFLPFLIKAASIVLKEMPTFNSSLDPSGENLITKHYYHIGIAVDTPYGLIVPVVRDVDKKTILELSEELMDISQRAKEKKLMPDEFKGGTFTISSLGGIGGSFFTPIINPPEVAIIGVSRSKWEPVFDSNSGEFIPRYILPFSLSYDHMVIDGANAVKFTTRFSTILENTDNFLSEV